MNKKIVGILTILILVVAAGVFLLIDRSTDTEPKVIQKIKKDEIATRNAQDADKPPPPGETKETRYWHGDHWHKTSPGAPETAGTPRESAEPPTDLPYPRGQTSSNPLFSDGVPEHLKCPKEWIGIQFDESSDEVQAKLKAMVNEIIEEYNPNRPIAEIWHDFIEEEKFYNANNVIHTNVGTEEEPILYSFVPLGMATYRLDWMMQQALDYPEAFHLALTDDLFFDVQRVAIGRQSPDWNKITLSDGRTFREKTGYYYEFTYYEGEGNPDPNDPHIHAYNGTLHTTRTGHSGRDARLIKVHLNNTSDEELEALSGWDFNINPYTQEATRK